MKAINLPTRQPVPFATNGTKFSIPATQPPASPGRASYDTGFPSETRQPIASGGTPPYGQDFNGLLFEMTTQGRWLQAGGTYTYDSAFATAIGGYPAGAVLKSATAGVNVLWVCTTDDNTADPDAGGAGWVAIRPNSGRAALPVAAGDLTPSAAQLTCNVLAVTGDATGMATTLRLPLVAGGSYIVNNLTTGSGATLNVQGATGTGVAVAQGQASVVFCDGTNYYSAGSSGAGQYLPIGGTAVAATKLATARAFNLTGTVTSDSQNFDGTTNVTLTTSIADGALSIAKTNGLQSALNGKLSLGGGTLTGALAVDGGTLTLNRNSTDYNVISLINTGGVQLQLDANGNGEGNLRTVTAHPLTFMTGNNLVLTLGTDKNATFTGSVNSQGYAVGSPAATSPTDLSKHISLYGGQMGFNITSYRLNYVVGAANSHVFVVNGLDIGKFTTGGLAMSNGAIKAYGGSATAFDGQGAYMAWNRTGGTGETDFINHKGGGSGGFFFFNTDGTTYTQIASLDANGNLTITGTGNFQGSDIRFKRDIRRSLARPIHRGLHLHDYKMIASGEAGRGVLAQDLLRHAKEYVSKVNIGTKEKPEERLTVNYAGTALEIALWAANEIDSMRSRARIERCVLAGLAIAVLLSKVV